MLATLNNNSQNDCWLNNNILNKILGYLYRASDISRSRGPAKYCEICQKYFQIHVDKTYLILILAIISVLFTPNVQISLQRVNNVPKLPGVLDEMSQNYQAFLGEISRFFCEFWLFSRENPAKLADFSENFKLKIPRNFAFFFFRKMSEALFILCTSCSLK